MKTGRSLQELAAEIERQNDSKRDFVVNTNNLRLLAPESGHVRLDMLDDRNPDHSVVEDMDMNEITHRQIGNYLGIPAKYYDKMLAEYPELLSMNVNGWFHKQPDTRMLRTLDGRARAFLSDRYHRIDNYDVAQTVLPVIGEIKDIRFVSCELTDAKLYIKAVNPRLQAEVKPGDVVQAGIVITNSETGQGSISVYPLVYRLICTNGMVAKDSGLSRRHVGKAITEDDNMTLFRDETIQADDRAFLMKVEDTVRAAADEAKFRYVVDKMRDATEAKITSTDVPGVVELTSREFNLTKEENNGVLKHLIEGSDLSLYGLANAVTRQSQDLENYDRASDLEAVGFDILTMNRMLWNRINSNV
jgi:hypothetical protein